MTEIPIQRLLLEALAVVERLGIPYMIVGGFAVRSWGIPRPTYDGDLAVSVDDRRMQDLLAALEQAGFDVPEEHRKGFRDSVAGIEKVKVTRFSGGTVWDVDLFLVRGAFLETALGRRRSRTLDQRAVWVAAAEDVILLKLMAYRRKDQLDVEEIMKVSTALDATYLRDWAARLGVAGRLAEFLP